jgi:fumarate hydratase class II
MAKIEDSQQLWGGETTKAIANFPVSGEPIPAPVARWLGRIKGAAAQVNAELGLLDRDKADRIAAAAARIANGELDDQFPIDVFQTGSGTSSNMNANEVIATLAGEGVHANDDVNMGQSSNDVFPSAVHLAALDRLVNDLLPALARLGDSLAAKAVEFDDVVKSGRTHWMDAVPVTLGQEFGGYAAQVREGHARVNATLERLGDRQAGVRGQLLAHLRGKLGVGVEPGPGRGAAVRDLADPAQGRLDPLRAEPDLGRVAAELLAEGDRGRIH